MVMVPEGEAVVTNGLLPVLEGSGLNLALKGEAVPVVAEGTGFWSR
jgi:hypothetical protein